MKKIFLFSVLVLAVAAGFLFYKNMASQAGGGSVCIKNNCFSVNLAKTSQQRETGLMYRQSLAKNTGMLFVFENEGIYPFWMKNTLIPLDIIWIDGNNKVVFIKANAEPCQSQACSQINPGVNAKYVLEVNAGVSEQAGFATGDPVEIKID